MTRFAKLTQDQLGSIKRLEQKWKGVILLAYEKPTEPAQLLPKQLTKLQALEKELGVVLVAYSKTE